MGPGLTVRLAVPVQTTTTSWPAQRLLAAGIAPTVLGLRTLTKRHPGRTDQGTRARKQVTGTYALGPEAGGVASQVTLAIRARVPLGVLRDTIQPFPSFSEIVAAALKALDREMTATG